MIATRFMTYESDCGFSLGTIECNGKKAAIGELQKAINWVNEHVPEKCLTAIKIEIKADLKTVEN